MLLAIVFESASCKKEMMNYEGMEGVYFSVRSGTNTGTPPFRPYTNIEFVKQGAGKQELTVNIQVTITGPLKDYDRTFMVEINPDSTTAIEGVHFLPVATSGIIPANSINGYIPVTLKRTSDLQQVAKRIGLRLVASEDFGLAFPDWKAIPEHGEVSRGNDTAWNNTLHTINVNDFMVQPAIWRGSVQPATNRETGSWGAFTRKKMELMCQLFNLKYEDFSSDLTMTLVLSNLITCYLVNEFNAGRLVKEDDGRLMWCGSVPWTSIVGVPY
jgi:hypothetical protein